MTKENLINHLKESGAYKPVLEPLIDSLMFNIEMNNRAKEEMTNDGVLKQIAKNKGKTTYYNKHHYYSIYRESEDLIRKLYKDLNLIIPEKVLISMLEKQGGTETEKQKREAFSKLFG